MKLAAIQKILEKRARGFHYTETQEEYVKAEEKETKVKTEKAEKNFFYGPECISKSEREGVVTDCGPVTLFSDFDDSMLNSSQSSAEEATAENLGFSKKRGRPRKAERTFLKITTDKKSESQKADPKLVLVKKKVTEHYVEPDSLAAKMLLDLSTEKNENAFEKFSEEDLEKRKAEIENEIKKLFAKKKF